MGQELYWPSTNVNSVGGEKILFENGMLSFTVRKDGGLWEPVEGALPEELVSKLRKDKEELSR